MRRGRALACWSVCILMFGAPPLQAATIAGLITSDEAPVVQAEVTLVRAGDSVVVKTVQTDIRGGYRFTVQSGAYRLRASKLEYADEWVNDIAVTDTDVTVNVGMTPQVFRDSSVVPSESDCN